MPLPLVSYLPFHKASANPVELPFLLQRLSHKQSRLQGRCALTPDIDLDAYRFEAVVDWIELKFDLTALTQHQHIQAELRRHLDRNNYIQTIGASPGGVGATFIVKIQEPKSIAALLDITDTLEARYGLRTRPTITGIEISLDAYSKKQMSRDRELLFGAMQRTIFTSRDIWAKQNDRPRSIYGSNREIDDPDEDRKGAKARMHYLCPSPIKSRHADDQGHLALTKFMAPAIDGTMYLGEKDGDVMVRVMDKIIDRQRPDDGVREDLPEHRKRVRVEVTLKGAELVRLGLNYLDDLSGFNFTKLQGDYFQFMLPTFRDQSKPMTKAADLARCTKDSRHANAFHRAGVIGLIALRRIEDQMMEPHMKTLRKNLRATNRASSKTRTGSGTAQDFVAYDALNRKVRVALQNLTKRETRAMTQRAARISTGRAF